MALIHRNLTDCFRISQSHSTLSPTIARPEDAGKDSTWRLHLQTLSPILALYLLLGFYGIDRQSLWQDEFHSLERVTSSIPIWQDGHGFLYFAALLLWTQLGTSELVLRSLSVLLGAASVCLVYTMSSSLLNRAAAVIGTLLFATSPFLIWYSQEARYITLMILSTLLTMYAFHQLIQRQRFLSWLIYGDTVLLALFSFLATLFIPIVQGLYLVAFPSHRPLLAKWIICQVVIFSFFTLWFVNGTHFWREFAETRASKQHSFRDNPKLLPFTGEFNNVRPAVIPYTFFALSAGFSLGPSPRELNADQTFAPLVPYAPMLFLLGVLYAGLLLSGLCALRGQRDAWMLLALWLFVPILGVFAIAKLLNIFYDARYIAMVLPAYLLVLAAGIARFKSFVMQMILLGTVLGVHGLALANYYFNPRYAREDTRAAAQFLEASAGPNDVVFVIGTVSSLPHYYKGTSPLVSFGTAHARDGSLERLRNLSVDDGRTLWLVQIRPWEVDRGGRVKAALDARHRLVNQQHFPGVDLYAYQISE